MSAAKRKRGHSLHLDLPKAGEEDRPPIAALFLITFDVKAGYTITWQRSIEQLDLSQSVEYKSLPSGLHNVEEDTIYFVHDEEYAGVSAYSNKISQDADRNSVMVAVGILLPSHGQLGRAWLYVDALKELAKYASENPSEQGQLEDFWSTHQLHDSSAVEFALGESQSTPESKQPQASSTPNGQRQKRNRAVSTASALASTAPGLSENHPARSLRTFIETFGPLIFAIYKLALLRKRILIITQAPVETACKLVYDCSLISGLPSAVSDMIPLEPLPIRLPPLFSVGLHDMDTLSGSTRSPSDTESEGFGWVACTTDDILSQKKDLYDYIVRLPPSHAQQAERKVWPHIFDSAGHEIKATQRDLRRYRILKQEIRQFDTSHSPQPLTQDPSRSLTSLIQESYDMDASSTLDADLAEEKSIMAIVYEGYMWWAAAGEKRTDLDEEEQQDAALLQQRTSEDGSRRRPSSARSPAGMDMMGQERASLEVTVVAFFHRLTTQIMTSIADIVTDADDASVIEAPRNEEDDDLAVGSNDQTPMISAEENEKRRTVAVEADDLSHMGLDLWSESDRTFVKELISFYWGRKASVTTMPRIECCGVRIC